jgi:hypothetical protein
MIEPSEQSQELFRLVVENVHDFAVYTKDLEGRTLSWNPGSSACSATPRRSGSGSTSPSSSPGRTSRGANPTGR